MVTTSKIVATLLALLPQARAFVPTPFPVPSVYMNHKKGHFISADRLHSRRQLEASASTGDIVVNGEENIPAVLWCVRIIMLSCIARIMPFLEELAFFTTRDKEVVRIRSSS